MFQPMTLLLQGLALQLSEPKIRQTAEVSSADVQEVEMVLEPHCMHIYSTYNKSLFLKVQAIEPFSCSNVPSFLNRWNVRIAVSSAYLSGCNLQLPKTTLTTCRSPLALFLALC